MIQAKEIRSRFSIQDMQSYSLSTPNTPNIRYQQMDFFFILSQSIVIRLDTGPCLRSGSSVICSAFSSSAPILRFNIWGFKPFPKFAKHAHALIIVRMIKTIVMTAKLVRDFRTGR